MHQITDAGIVPWVRIANAGEREHGYEITYWSHPSGRTLLFVCLNPEIRGTSLGGGNSVGLKSDTIAIKLRFEHQVSNVRDERSNLILGDGREFEINWKQNEAVVLSFER